MQSENEIRDIIKRHIHENPEYLHKVYNDLQLLYSIATDEHVYYDSCECMVQYLQEKRLLTKALQIVFKEHGIDFDDNGNCCPGDELRKLLILLRNDAPNSDGEIIEYYMEYEYELQLDWCNLENFGLEVMFLGTEEEEVLKTIKDSYPQDLAEKLINNYKFASEMIDYSYGTWMFKIKHLKETLDKVEQNEELKQYMERILKRLKFMFGVNWNSNEGIFMHEKDGYILQLLGENESCENIHPIDFCSDTFFHIYLMLCIEEYIKIHNNRQGRRA